MNARRCLRQHSGKALGWLRIRSGWYFVKVGADELYVHIRRSNDEHPEWGWDVLTSDSRYEVARTGLVWSGLATLNDAKGAAEDMVANLRNRA